MKRRLGYFLLIMGLILLVVFFTHDQSQDPQASIFFLGLAGVLLGGYMSWHYRTPAGPSERFRSVRKMVNKQNPKK